MKISIRESLTLKLKINRKNFTVYWKFYHEKSCETVKWFKMTIIFMLDVKQSMYIYIRCETEYFYK